MASNIQALEPGIKAQLLERAMGCLRAGDADEARRLADCVLTSQPGDAEASYLIGLLALQQGQLPAARRLIEQALAAIPQAPSEWHANFANVLEELADTQQAIRHFELALNLKPELLAARLRLADLLLRSKQPAAAAEQYAHALEQQPQRLETAISLAYAWLAEQRYEEALRAGQHALQYHPAAAEAHLALGNIHSECSDPVAARAAYHEALRLDPQCLAAEINLAASWRSDGDYRETYRRLLDVLRRHPGSREAHVQLIRSIAADSSPLPAATPGRDGTAATPATPLISVIVCSIDERKFAATRQMYATLLADTPYELIRIADARSLSEGYNRGLAQSRGELLLFAHDDIEIVCPNLAGFLRQYLASHDLLGIAGTSRLIGQRWGDAGWPHQHGWVSHPSPKGGLELTIFRVLAPISENIEGVDGLFFAVRRPVAEALLFDAQVFDGFHFYDLDFSYRAFLAGYRLAVCSELTVIHHSQGRFDARWEIYAQRFATKHQATLSKQPPAPGAAINLHFTSARELDAYCRRYLSVLRQFAAHRESSAG